MERLAGNVQLLYADLLQGCLHSAAPSGRGLSFVTKLIRGRRHWYLQLTVGGRKTQHYLGPDGTDLRRRIAREKALWTNAEPALRNRQKLVSALIASGANVVTGAEARVLGVLERAGVFLAGGTIVGSQAFRVYGNMLGVLWDRQASTTQDIDIADSAVLPIGVPPRQVDLSAALSKAGLGIFEVPALDRKAPSTSFIVRGMELRVDLLTPMHGKPRRKPVFLPALNTYAEPMHFLDYLLEDIQPSVVAAGAGILVNVPHPGRYAFHKLMLSDRRQPYWQTKSAKDLEQAGALFTALLELRPGDITTAWEISAKQPAAFRKHVKVGWNKLPRPLTGGITADTGVRPD